MNPFLAALFGQQSSSQTVGNPKMPGIISGFGGGTFDVNGNPVTPVEEPIGEEIVVNGKTRSGMSPQDGPRVGTRLIGNTGDIEAAQQAVKLGQDVSERKGMFGMKGTLRDVLGTLGDAFLVQGGANAVYAPTRKAERVSDAWAGATESNEAMLAAAERVAQIDPELGQQLLEKAQTDAYRTSQMESLDASRQASIQDKDLARYTKARTMIGGLFNTPGAVVNGMLNPKAYEIAQKMAASANMSLEDFLINEGMSEEEVRGFAQSVMNPYQQETLEDRDISLTQGQQRADASTSQARSAAIRAARPPAGRAPRAENADERYTRISSQPAGERSAGDQDWYETERRIRLRQGEPSRRGRRGGSSTGTTAPKPSVSNW